jgi:hypothetical protein
MGEYERYLSRRRGDSLIIMASSTGPERIVPGISRVQMWCYDGWRSGGWIYLCDSYYEDDDGRPVRRLSGDHLEAAYNWRWFGDVN